MNNPKENKQKFFELWRQISAHYKSYSNKLIFELLNEPNGLLYDDLWNEYLNQAIKIIRSSNPTRYIIVGSTDWNRISKLERLKLPLKDGHIIATFHFYEPFFFTHQGAEWVNPIPPVGVKWPENDKDDKDYISSLFDVAYNWSKKNNIPLLLGEFGAYSKADMKSRIAWTNYVVKEAEKRNISWCYWEFCAGFGIYDKNKKKFNELFSALISKK